MERYCPKCKELESSDSLNNSTEPLKDGNTAINALLDRIEAEVIGEKYMSEKQDKNTQKPQDLPRIYKEEEFALMLKFVKLGLWGSSNLSKACGVDIGTIADWKKRPEVAVAYREAVEKVIRKRQNISDPERLMKELDLDVDMSLSSLTQNNIYVGLNDDQLDKLIESKIHQVGVGISSGGETEKNANGPDEIRDTA